jgi:hypothetical protein
MQAGPLHTFRALHTSTSTATSTALNTTTSGTTSSAMMHQDLVLQHQRSLFPAAHSNQVITPPTAQQRSSSTLLHPLLLQQPQAQCPTAGVSP